MARTASQMGKRPRFPLSVINFTLAKRAVLREYRRGMISRLDICDAHPELMRAAENVGEDLLADCPVCDAPRLRRLAYVYSDELKRDNGRVWTLKEALAITAKCSSGTCYVVEVCTDCSWNHLAEAFVG